MDELLNLLRVKLCNCTLDSEEVEKLKDYIENGGNDSRLSEIHKYNIENSLRGYNSSITNFWKLMDSFMDDEEVFKRILNVFLAVGQESFFKAIYNRFYSIQKVSEYLKPMENKERLLIWLISKSSNYELETIKIVEEMLNEDKQILTKSFVKTEDNFVKLALAALAIKNSCKLQEDAEEFIKKHFMKNINKYLRDKQAVLIDFLVYAEDKSKGLGDIIGNAINSSANKIVLFDKLLNFISHYDSTIQSYDIVQAFNIDKKLYVRHLINAYIEEENKKVLKEINERFREIPLVFRESLEETAKNKIGKSNFDDVENLTIAYFIYSNSKDNEDYDKLKKAIEKILIAFVYSSKVLEVIPRMEKAKVLQYIIDGHNKGCMDSWADKVEKGAGNGTLWFYHAFCFKLIYSMEETRGIMYRFLELEFKTKDYDLAAFIIDKLIEKQDISFESFIKELAKLGVRDGKFVLIVDRALNKCNLKNTAKFIQYLIKMCNEENEELINLIDSLNINVREIVLENLFNHNKEKYSKLLVNHLLDDSKVLRDKLITILSSYEECKENVLNSFKSRKLAVREAAAKILINFDMRDFKVELEGFAKKEKNEKVKVLILNMVNADHLDDKILQNSESMNKYCSDRIKKTSYEVPSWISVNQLQEVRYEDGKKVSKHVIEYLISKYSLENVVERNLLAEKVIEKCNKQDLAVLGNQILNIWIDNGADTKQKWILSLVSAIGDFNVINRLKSQIDLWSKSSRGAIACEAIKGLALIGSDEALIILDTIARKFKHKQIKKAAEEAFVYTAKMLNLTEEELEDKIVPSLGFNNRGERKFDFGSRSFTVTLEMDFSLKVKDSNGKVIKTMPKPNKSDDELKANEAFSEFKLLKKQIKTIVSTQVLRLEMALSTNRLWKKVDWEKLFVENPIMHNFSLGLVWGVYDRGELKATFRYMEDGTLNTKDEEEYTLLETSNIGLVHPLEMDKATLESWKQQFEDYEIVQPFPQLYRKIYAIKKEEEKVKCLERFAGIKINGLSLVGKLTKMGWYRGSVQDGGGYYQFYKEDKKIGIGVELQFDWLGVGYENDETTIYELIFYKASTVERGSYIYDEVTEENRILPASVPKRFFSEILYDVDRALEAKTGFAANWKLNR